MSKRWCSRYGLQINNRQKKNPRKKKVKVSAGKDKKTKKEGIHDKKGVGGWGQLRRVKRKSKKSKKVRILNRWLGTIT